MAIRISEKDLQGMVDRLNRVTNSPATYSGKDGANVGHYTLGMAFGGYQLQRVTSKGGACTTPLGGGYCTKKELYEKVYTFICGIEFAQT